MTDCSARPGQKPTSRLDPVSGLDPAAQLRAHFIRALPKAELHLHLEGCVPPHRAAALAHEAGVNLPGLEPDGSSPLGWRYVLPDFRAFLLLYWHLSRCLTTRSILLHLIDAVAETLEQNQVRYAEVTFTPMTHVLNGWNPDMLLDVLMEGRIQAEESRGVTIRWVFDIVRSMPDQALQTVALALRGRSTGVGVVALGVGGPEHPRLTGQPLVPAFSLAKANALPSVPHAGEQTGAWAVWEALELFHPIRIGHGMRSIDDPKLLETLAERGICLEVCPTSNLKLVGVPALADHPLPHFLASGIPVALATDDPGLLDNTLNDEYARCADAFGWSLEALAKLAGQSVRYGLADEAFKQTLLQAQQEALTRFQLEDRG